MDWYRPGAVVLQCGADSLAGDKLGCFNLSMRGHAACVSFLQSFNVPLMCVGGGGYTVRNVARTWTYETALLLGRQPDEDLPFNDYMNWFGPEYKLDVRPTSMDNLNSDAYLEGLRSRVIDNLRALPFAPSVQSHPTPKYAMNGHAEGDLSDDEEQGELEKRITNRVNQARIQQHLQYPPSDSESDGQDDPCGVQSAPLRRTQSNASSRTQPVLYSGNSALDASSRHRRALFQPEGSASSTLAKAGKRWLSMGYTPSGGFSSSSHGSGPPEPLRKILASSKAMAAVNGSARNVINGVSGRRDSDAEDSADEDSVLDDDDDRARRDPDDGMRDYDDGVEDEDRTAFDGESEIGVEDERRGNRAPSVVDRTRLGKPKRSFFNTAKPYRRPVLLPHSTSKAVTPTPPHTQPPPIRPDQDHGDISELVEMDRGRRGEGGGSENVDEIMTAAAGGVQNNGDSDDASMSVQTSAVATPIANGAAAAVVDGDTEMQDE